MVVKAWRVEEMRGYCSGGTKFQLCKMDKSGDFMDSNMTIVNTVLYP